VNFGSPNRKPALVAERADVHRYIGMQAMIREQPLPLLVRTAQMQRVFDFVHC